MEIDVEQSDGRVRLLVSGILDEKGAELLKSRLASINTGQVREVELECANVRHFGSSSIGKLLVFYKHFTSGGGKLKVSNLPSPIYEMFLELKLDTLFPIGKSS